MSGKWDDPTVPNKGWYCVEVYDSCEYDEGLHFVCEMCETQLIRYIHVMSNLRYSGLLECGCICAGRMEGSEERAKARESIARKRDKFPDRANWNISKKGNHYIRVDGYVVTIYRGGGGYKVSINGPQDEQVRFFDMIYNDVRTAQKGSYENLMRVQGRLQ